jgi:hypothetical protein
MTPLERIAVTFWRGVAYLFAIATAIAGCAVLAGVLLDDISGWWLFVAFGLWWIADEVAEALTMTRPQP